MHLFRSIVLSLLIGAGSTSATASVTWVCALSEDAMNLVCAAEADAAGLAVTNARPLVVVNGTEFPLSPMEIYAVPLYSPPTDMATLDQLAREVLCLAAVRCRVVYAVPSLGRVISDRLRPYLAALR